jgi:hypothetical protein
MSDEGRGGERRAIEMKSRRRKEDAERASDRRGRTQDRALHVRHVIPQDADGDPRGRVRLDLL